MKYYVVMSVCLRRFTRRGKEEVELGGSRKWSEVVGRNRLLVLVGRVEGKLNLAIWREDCSISP